MDHVEFMERLRVSRERFERFRSVQSQNGIEIMLPAQFDAPSREKRYSYSDKGDGLLHAWVEFKVRSIDFTCRDDYPFETFIIDEAYKIDRKPHACPFYVISNKAETHCGVVYGWTRPHWKITEQYDGTTHREAMFYTVAIDKVRFCKTEEVFVCRSDGK